MATIAAASYCAKYSNTKLYDWSCTHCKASGVQMTDITSMYVSDTGTWAFTGHSPDGGTGRIVVSFTGTDPINWRNWVVNLSFAKMNYGACTGCEVHTGFFYAYLRVRPQLLHNLNALQKKYPGAPVFITGHSLGGAIATHAIADLYNHAFQLSQLNGHTFVRGGNPAYDITSPILSEEETLLLGGSVSAPSFTLAFPSYTFGAPRVGNAYFANWLLSTLGSTRLYRLTHHRDPVPHVPTMSMGFRHTSTEVFYNSESTYYTICSGANGEDPNCSNYFTFDLNVSNHGVYAGYQFDHSSDACT
jgi:hypothetical protein